MPNPKWDNASVDQKLELLRGDIGQAFDILNVLRDDTGNAWRLARSVEAKLSEVSKAVAALTAQPSKEKRPKA